MKYTNLRDFHHIVAHALLCQLNSTLEIKQELSRICESEEWSKIVSGQHFSLHDKKLLHTRFLQISSKDL